MSASDQTVRRISSSQQIIPLPAAIAVAQQPSCSSQVRLILHKLHLCLQLRGASEGLIVSDG